MALLSGFSIFVTFVICGLWHGDAIGMILFGALSGLVLGVEAVATATFWPAIARSLQARPTLAIPYRFLCRLVTFHVAIATFAPVLLSGQQLAIILNTTLG